jgi:NAD(P)-dependent dehydrogenase (short-subunit alcohol dehydrogenase family)
MRTLIVTGGTGGLGSAVVERLARDYRCVLLHRSGSTPPSLANVEGVVADLNDAESVRSAVTDAAQRLGAPYGLVHLAGGYAGGTTSETDDATWQSMLSLNVTGAFVAFRETLSHMRRDAPGRIVAVSSEATRSRPATAAAYTVSKCALNVLVELTASELRGTGITVNAVAPATLDTPAMRAAMPGATLVPLMRVAETIAFLLSDSGGSVSGAILPLE